jgi:AraC family transcriptional regulator, regulatory protein of adaptative response / DNA-3-methyladenine glycosylase II
MTEPATPRPLMRPDAYTRAVDARDPRFDGLFFVGVTSTGIYCRPICPARVSHPERRRFFASAAAAERAGFRPCLRCRPELAPGRAPVDAVSRLAREAGCRIAAGALNGRSVSTLARELGVSERHLRRALERELGVSPVALAQTHRLLLAKQLLADTTLSVTNVAYASGFQSLRRFNAAFAAQYRMPPSAVRRVRAPRRGAAAEGTPETLVRLTLSYRAPLAWDTLLAFLRRAAVPGVEVIEGRRYGRTARVDGRTGLVFAEDAAGARGTPHVAVDVSESLVPALMPLLVRVRQLFDLDAEPSVVDTHLAECGLGRLADRRPGIRVPGAFDAFEVALRLLLRTGGRTARSPRSVMRRLVRALGERVESGHPRLQRVGPGAARVADAGARRLEALGVPRASADTILQFSRAVATGSIRLRPGGDPFEARRALLEIPGLGDAVATMIVMRISLWPDAFPAADPALQCAAGVADATSLLATARAWRPWRAYAAMHLWLADADQRAASRQARAAHREAPHIAAAYPRAGATLAD